MSKKTRRNRLARANPPLYLNAYQVDRAFGGREEGGWWYDYGLPLASRKARRSEKIRLARLEYCHYGRHSSRRGQVRLIAVSAQIAPEVRAKQLQTYKTTFAHLDDPAGIDSVVCRGVVHMYVEAHPGKAFPDVIPRYE